MIGPLLTFPRSLWQRRELWWNLSRREVSGRYRGSVLGWSWSFLTPLLMLAVYTFVFSNVFKARWSGLEEVGPLGFALNLFAGLVVFNVFSECATTAPGLILANVNFVTRVIFPLEILAATTVAAAGFHALTGAAVLLVFELLVLKGIPLTIFWLPLVWLPLVLGSLALTWLLSAAGVFFRDLGQMMGVVVSMLMFLSTVFYPLSALPPAWQPVLASNPLVLIIEQTRRVAVQGLPPSPAYVLMGTLLAVAGCELAFRLFRRCQRGFADVL